MYKGFNLATGNTISWVTVWQTEAKQLVVVIDQLMSFGNANDISLGKVKYDFLTGARIFF